MAKDICASCGQEEPPKRGTAKRCKRKDQTIGWICCDSCNNWFHTACVRASSTLLQKIDTYWYFCANCTILGTLVLKQISPPVDQAREDFAKITSTINELSEKLTKLQTELEIWQQNCRKETNKVRNQLLASDQLLDRNSAQRAFVANIETKLAVIESGARFANTCLQSVNGPRIAINKIPFREGENVKFIVRNALRSLGIDETASVVSSCFRTTAKASKWSDRSISPTIIVVLNSREAKEKILKQYFKNCAKAKLSALQAGLALEYRFTVNEVLSVESFRIRNLALRLKHKKLVDSVFVRNDTVSVKLSNHERYTLITSSEHLLKLVSPTPCEDVIVDESRVTPLV